MTDESQRKELLAMASVFAAVFTLHVWLSTVMEAPVIHGDEVGYFATARWLARQGVQSGLKYFPGYSLFLAPIFWFTEDALTAYRASLVVNGAFAGATSCVHYLIVRRVARFSSLGTRILATFTVSLFPAMLLFSNLIMSESMFALLYAATVLLVHRTVTTNSPIGWAVVGFTAASLYAVHPRGLVVLLSLALVSAWSLWPWRRSASQLGALAAGAAICVVGTRALIVATTGGGSAGDADYTVSSLLTGFPDISYLRTLAPTIAGQLFYIALASASLAAIGLALAFRASVRLTRGTRDATGYVLVFAGTSTILMLGLSSAFMRRGGRLDALIYGRYVEGVMGPLILLAAISLLGARDPLRTSLRDRLIIGLVPVLAGAAGLAIRGDFELRGDVNPVNVLGLYPQLRYLSGIKVAPLLVYGVLVVTAVAFLSRVTPVPSLVVIGAVFLATSLYTNFDYFKAGSHSRGGQRVVADHLDDVVRVAGGPSCVGYDQDSFSFWHEHNYRFFYPKPIVRFSTNRRERPCSSLFISGRNDITRLYPGSAMVLPENHFPQALWVLPGREQRRLSALGWILPESDELPKASRRARITISGRNSRETLALRAGDEINLVVGHAGSGSPWPSHFGISYRQGAIGIWLRAMWREQGQSRIALTQDVPLPKSLLPGSEVTIPMRIGSDLDRLRSGTYAVRFQLIQSGRTFARPLQGGPALLVRVG